MSILQIVYLVFLVGFTGFNLWLMWHLWSKQPTWGQVRVRAVTRRGYRLVRCIVLTAIAGLVWETYCLLTGTSLFLELTGIAMFGVIGYVLLGVVWFRFSHPEKFQLKRLRLLLTPVLCGALILSFFKGAALRTAAREGIEQAVRRAPVARIAEEGVEVAAHLGDEGLEAAVQQTARRVVAKEGAAGAAGIAYVVLRGGESRVKGELGEELTEAFLREQKLVPENAVPLTAGYGNNHGIDHCFARFADDGSIEKAWIVESKTNQSRLGPGQMSDDWILGSLRQAAVVHPAAKEQLGLLATLVRSENGDVAVLRWLVHHDIDTLQTTVTRLGHEGEELNRIGQWVLSDSVIGKALAALREGGWIE